MAAYLRLLSSVIRADKCTSHFEKGCQQGETKARSIKLKSGYRMAQRRGETPEAETDGLINSDKAACAWDSFKLRPLYSHSGTQLLEPEVGHCAIVRA